MHGQNILPQDFSSPRVFLDCLGTCRISSFLNVVCCREALWIPRASARGAISIGRLARPTGQPAKVQVSALRALLLSS